MLPECLRVISEQATLSPVCREASFEKGARKRGRSGRRFLLMVREAGDDTPNSRSARRCHVFMPGCTWVNLWWRRWSGRRPSITSEGTSDSRLQRWQDLWCRESDRGIQTALPNVSVHGAPERQPHNKPAIITSSGHPASAWHEPKSCRGSGTAPEAPLMRKAPSLSGDCRQLFSMKKKSPFPLVCGAFITDTQSITPVVRASSCGGDRIMFRNVWGNLRMMPLIFAFTCQRWQPETCPSRSEMPGCERQQRAGRFQNVCLWKQRTCRAGFDRPPCAAKPTNPEHEKPAAVEGDMKRLLICFHLSSPLTRTESLAARL